MLSKPLIYIYNIFICLYDIYISDVDIWQYGNIAKNYFLYVELFLKSRRTVI